MLIVLQKPDQSLVELILLRCGPCMLFLYVCLFGNGTTWATVVSKIKFARFQRQALSALTESFFLL